MPGEELESRRVPREALDDEPRRALAEQRDGRRVADGQPEPRATPAPDRLLRHRDREPAAGHVLAALDEATGDRLADERLEVPLALQLLEMNALLRFGAFAYVPAGDVIIFSHTLLGGATLDAEELNTTIRDVAIIADEYDDRIAARYGGQTMQELLEESVIDHFRTAHGKDHFKS